MTSIQAKTSAIGERFSKKQFQEALKIGHVNSITVFSKCHHGWSYHPSNANEMHPELKFDLLKSEIDAAHEIGVKTPVYLSAGLDEKAANKHPEWLARNKNDSLMGGSQDFVHPAFHKLCFNSPYLDTLIAQIEEVCENYDADGIFLDIVGVTPCYCRNCVNTLIADAHEIENVSAKETAVRENPYFNRTSLTYCSHRHAPTSTEYAGSGIVMKDNTAYIAWNIFEDYAKNGSLVVKKTVCHILDRLLEDKTVKTNLPAQGVVTLTKQNEREILHLLYASPVKRGENVEIIEDILPLYNIKATVRYGKKAQRVYLAPQNEDIEFSQNNNEISFIVPKTENHQMVVIE